MMLYLFLRRDKTPMIFVFYTRKEMLKMFTNIFQLAKNTKKIFLLFALLLGTLMFGFAGGKAYAENPPELEDTYVIDGITYYNVKSSHITTPQLFMRICSAQLMHRSEVFRLHDTGCLWAQGCLTLN